MIQRSFDNNLPPDTSLYEFIDTFDLPKADAEFLKKETSNPPVAQELQRLWHELEIRGADEVRGQVRDSICELIKGLRS